MLQRSLTLVLIVVLAQSAMAQTPARPSSPPPPNDGSVRLNEPLAGWSDGTMFLRSPDNLFQLFLNGRLQTDAYFYVRPTDALPFATFLIKRARIEMFGWIGPWVGFNVAGDFAAGPTAAANPVAPSSQNATDDYIMIAPWRDLLMLQVGQFDAPFTLENRTSDKYFDFIERSHTVRAFAIPSNKEMGAMVHGILPSQLLYYSLGVFNGDGTNFKNVDINFDVMGRGWVAPFALLKNDLISNITVGGSFWFGNRGSMGLALAPQQTPAGFAYSAMKWKSPDDPTTSLELHQFGRLRALAFELDAPINHRYGLRFEYVNKHQDLGEDDVSQSSSGKLTPLGLATLNGWSMYVQAWAWVIGDDTIVGRPGLQLPPRFTKFGTRPPRHGLQLLARVERLDEHITTDSPALNDPNVGRATVTSLQLGTTYWYSKRYRAMANYVFNNFGGDSSTITASTWKNLGGNHNEHEFLVRLAIAL